MEQMDLFTVVEEQEKETEAKLIFREWQGLPEGKYIWLNHIEAPEYWVINDEGNPCGEHIETCPYCGADLKNGAGDVVLVKADGGWWVIRGFLKGDSTNV